jgi:hypothetical protein
VERARDLLGRTSGRYRRSFLALEAVRVHRIAFGDAMLWASAQRAGVNYLLTEDFQDGFVLRGVTFVNPFHRANDQVIDELVLPRS